jgi:hypothetical protein
MPLRKRCDLTATKLRSALTNGSAILRDVDHRLPWMRRLRDLLAAHESDLGGRDNISEAERSLIRRASMLELQCELMEHKFALADGEATTAQLNLYSTTTNTLRRLLQALGLHRRARDVTPVPSLREYLAQRQLDAAE